MSDLYEEVLADLKAEFGKKIFLTPSDISIFISRSPAAQASLRSRKRFPIPYSKLGGKITIKIYDLARYIATDTSEPEQPCLKAIAPTKTTTKNSISRRRASLGRSLMSFSRQIEETSLQLEFMNLLYVELEKIALSQETSKPKLIKKRL